MRSAPLLTTAVFAALPLLSSPAHGQGAAALFEARTLEIASRYHRLESLADVDGDGRPELVGWWSKNPGELTVRYHTQDATLGSWSSRSRRYTSSLYRRTPSTPANDWLTAIGDLDADGRDELAILFERRLQVFDADEYGNPLLVADQDLDPVLGAPPDAVVAADLGGDDRDDLLVVVADEVVVLRSTAGGFERASGYRLGGASLSVAVADVFRIPGDEVLVLQERPTPAVWVFAQPGTGLSEPTRFELRPGAGGAASDPIKLAPGDVDGDGDEDVVVFGMGGHYQVLRNTWGGVVVEAPAVGGPATDLADVDGDGDLDGICCGGGSGGSTSTYHNTPGSQFHVCLNLGDGVFDRAQAFAGQGARRVAGAIDYDLDGDLDVVAGRRVLVNRERVGAELCASEPNSTGDPGRLRVGGRPSQLEGGPWFVAEDLPPRAVGMLLVGHLHAPTPFWDGTTCVHPDLRWRLGAANADAEGVADFGRPYTSGTILQQGFRSYQVWYRDPRAGRTGANTTSTMRVLLTP